MASCHRNHDKILEIEKLEVYFFYKELSTVKPCISFLINSVFFFHFTVTPLKTVVLQWKARCNNSARECLFQRHSRDRVSSQKLLSLAFSKAARLVSSASD